jgi:serine/threonine protein kinase
MTPLKSLADENVRRRFRQETLALAKLSHSNIESIHDFDTQEDVDFLVMEYFPGVTLSEKLKSGPLSEQETLRHGEQLAEGLVTAHGKGVVHRDLKPGNLRTTPEGELKILDFGLAKLLRPSSNA